MITVFWNSFCFILYTQAMYWYVKLSNYPPTQYIRELLFWETECVTSSTTITSHNACMCDFWAVSGGKILTVSSYCKLIPGRHSMRVNSSPLFFSIVLPYMKSPLSELVLLQFYWEL